jgi:hypothetical protein
MQIDVVECFSDISLLDRLGLTLRDHARSIISFAVSCR